MMFRSTKNFATGFAVGLGVGLVAREAWPYISEAARPLSKALVKAGMEIYNRSEQTYWMLRETFEDMISESKAEFEQEQLQKELKTKKTAVEVGPKKQSKTKSKTKANITTQKNKGATDATVH